MVKQNEKIEVTTEQSRCHSQGGQVFVKEDITTTRKQREDNLTTYRPEYRFMDGVLGYVEA